MVIEFRLNSYYGYDVPCWAETDQELKKLYV